MAILRSDSTIGGRTILTEIDNLGSRFLPLTGGTLTGNLRLKNSTNYGMKLNFGDGDYCYIYEPSDDHLKIHASNLLLDGPQTDANTATTAQYRGMRLDTSTPTSLVNGVVSLVYS